MLPGLSPVGGKAIVARFDGGCMSSDGGLLTLREVEQRLAIAPRLAACLRDPRDPSRVVHGLDDIIRTRMLMIAAGYEDGNDADTLRRDPMFKLAMGEAAQGSAGEAGGMAAEGACRTMATFARSRPFRAWRTCRMRGPCCAWAVPWWTTIARASAKCRAASCSISTTRSIPCMAASNCGCSTPIMMNTVSSRSWCSMVTAA
jgi:hypothetical protein